jgi:hypothetical protein
MIRLGAEVADRHLRWSDLYKNKGKAIGLPSFRKGVDRFFIRDFFAKCKEVL